MRLASNGRRVKVSGDSRGVAGVVTAGEMPEELAIGAFVGAMSIFVAICGCQSHAPAPIPEQRSSVAAFAASVDESDGDASVVARAYREAYVLRDVDRLADLSESEFAELLRAPDNLLRDPESSEYRDTFVADGSVGARLATSCEFPTIYEPGEDLLGRVVACFAPCGASLADEDDLMALLRSGQGVCFAPVLENSSWKVVHPDPNEGDSDPPSPEQRAN